MSQFGKQVHSRSKTKKSGNGKRRNKISDKHRSEIGNYFTATKLSDKSHVDLIRRRGGKETPVLKKAGFANLLTKQGYKKVAIKGVLESHDNRNFARQNIITKGTLITTELGKAVVLNRPGREGNINAKLVEA
jgi:small subunit ribosomal protein S8e